MRTYVCMYVRCVDDFLYFVVVLLDDYELESRTKDVIDDPKYLARLIINELLIYMRVSISTQPIN